jgi:hypothetical protein
LPASRIGQNAIGQKEKRKMNTLKNQGLKTLVAKVRSIKGWRMLFAFTLVAAFAAASALGPMQLAQADAGGVTGHTFDVTFTIWMTSPPNFPSFLGVSLAGVVGGAVGDGSFAGKVLSEDLSLPGFWQGLDQFEFNGEKHSFVADVHIKHDTTTGLAVITGVVTHGWLKGAPLTGGYTTYLPCPIPTPGNAVGMLCFQGALHIHRGGGSE